MNALTYPVGMWDMARQAMEQLAQSPQMQTIGRIPSAEMAAPVVQPQSGGLAGLATKVPEGTIKMTGSGHRTDIVWNADKTAWRYPASYTWHPASEQPRR